MDPGILVRLGDACRTHIRSPLSHPGDYAWQQARAAKRPRGSPASWPRPKRQNRISKDGRHSGIYADDGRHGGVRAVRHGFFSYCQHGLAQRRQSASVDAPLLLISPNKVAHFSGVLP